MLRHDLTPIKTLPSVLQNAAGSFLLSVLCSTSPITVFAQQSEDNERVVHLLQEPRHRTVKQDGGVFLLDVQINPGDTSYSHTHNQPILLTYISDAEGPRHGEVVARTEYANKPLTHTVTNPGPNLLHIMAMVNDNPGVPADFEDSPTGLTLAPQIENRWFRSYALELQPGESTQAITHQNPIAVILGTEGLIQVTRDDGITAELDKPGDWAWRDAGSRYLVRNEGSTSCTVLINESRRRRN